MRLLFVGDFNIDRGTGYSTILRNVCLQLAESEEVEQLTILGEKWGRREHHFPFQVIPSEYVWIPMQVLRLCQALWFDHVILAMDVPKIHQILGQLELQGINWGAKISGLFPIESDPLIDVWAKALRQLHRRFVISEFGQRRLKIDAGLDSIFLPMTSEFPEQELSMEEAREKLGVPRDAVLLLTVAANQERKDLPTIASAVTWLGEHGTKALWLLVTTDTSFGWTLPNMLKRTGVREQTRVKKWLSPEMLSCAYQAADLFVLASQAEGACLPLYEAMAHGLPCVAPDHTAITEVLAGGRGTPVDPSFVTMHPFGNVNRYHVLPHTLGEAVMRALGAPSQNGAMRDFIESRPWSLAARRMEEGLSE